MKKLIILNILLISFNNLLANNLLKPRANLICKNKATGKTLIANLDLASIDNEQKNWSEFFISFKPDTQYKIFNNCIEYPLLENIADISFLAGLPFISPYGLDKLVRYKERLALMLMQINMLERVMPASLKNALANQLGVNQNNLIANLKQRKTSFYVVVLGDKLLETDSLPADNIYNIRYHFWDMLWHNPERSSSNPLNLYISNMPDFNDPVLMGIFEPIGVEYLAASPNTSIAFNNFKVQNVFWHKAVSPNNARFKITNKIYLSSFWLAAISPDKQYINITYFLIANNNNIKALIADILKNSNNISEIRKQIENLAKNKPNWVPDQNIQVLQNWINTLVKAVSSETVQDIKNLRRALSDLTSKLTSLKLRNLSLN